VPVVTAARPIDGDVAAAEGQQPDAVLSTAVELARRAVLRPAAAPGRTTAAR
jgi:hypothetical protein